MSTLPIFKFDASSKSALWGGGRLCGLFGKSAPAEGVLAESWELFDLGAEFSPVKGGDFAGMAPGELARKFGPRLLGDVRAGGEGFPLMVKFIDAGKELSVQVHPTAEACRSLGGGFRPKTEAWYVVDAVAGAFLYAGFAPGVDSGSFREALRSGGVAEQLNKLPVKRGDIVLIPAGTVHAIGGGIVLAEVQQSSTTTFRVYDWGRVGADGRPRQLHEEEAFASLDFKAVPPGIEAGRVACPYFSLEELTVGPSGSLELASEGALFLVGVSGSGSASVTAGEHREDFLPGDTILVPAEAASRCVVEAVEGFTFLKVGIPGGE